MTLAAAGLDALDPITLGDSVIGPDGSWTLVLGLSVPMSGRTSHTITVPAHSAVLVHARYLSCSDHGAFADKYTGRVLVAARTRGHYVPGLLRRNAVLIFFLFACYIVALLKFLFPEAMSDEGFWLIWLGRVILATHHIPRTLGPETLISNGVRWSPHEWLAGVILAEFDRSKVKAVVPYLGAAICMIPIVVTALRLQAAKANRIFIFLGLFLLSAAMTQHDQVRAEIFSIAGLSLILWILESRSRTQLFIPLIILITINMHASTLILAVLPTVVLCSDAASVDTRSKITHIQILSAILALAATICTPFGVDTWTYAFSLSFGHIHRYISEWQPLISFFPLRCDPGNMFIALMSIGACVLALIQRNIKRHEALILLIFFPLGMYAYRLFILFIVAAYPIAFRLKVADIFRRIQNRIIVNGCICACIVLQIMRTFTNVMKQQVVEVDGSYIPASWSFPELIGNPSAERVFCSDFSLCNVYLYSGAKVFMDGRADPFPIQLWQEQMSISGSEPKWRQRLAKLRVNVIVAHPTDAIAQTLSHDHEWHEAARERSTKDNLSNAAVVFVKRKTSLGGSGRI